MNNTLPQAITAWVMSFPPGVVQLVYLPIPEDEEGLAAVVAL